MSVGDWERTFGDGISTDQIIETINSSWLRNEGNSEYADDERDPARFAFRGCRLVKSDYIAHLRDEIGDVAGGFEGGLLSGLRNSTELREKSETEHFIPKPLWHIIDVISEGMRFPPMTYDGSAERDHDAANWVIRCFLGIQPGTDLRFISLKLAGELSQAAYARASKSVRKKCYPARELIYARARGVFPPGSMASFAKGEALSILARPWDNSCPPFAQDPDDFSAMILNNALSDDEESAAEALNLAVSAEWGSIKHDCDHAFIWNRYADRILNLLENAPTHRVKIINMDSILGSRDTPENRISSH